MVPADSFLAVLLHCEQLPQIKQRMTTEEIFAVFGEGNVLGPDKQPLLLSDLSGQGDDGGAVAIPTTIRCGADNAVWFSWGRDEDMWALWIVGIQGTHFLDSKEVEGPARSDEIPEPQVSDFGRQEFARQLFQIEQFRRVRLGMTMQECQDAIGGEDNLRDWPTSGVNIVTLGYEVGVDMALALTFLNGECSTIEWVYGR